MDEKVFTVFEGPDAGKAFVLAGSPIVIGREIGRDVVLNDDRASRRHTQIIPDGDRVRIIDLNSSNGTFVNGKLVTDCELCEGDIIGIAGTKIVFGREAPSPESVRNTEEKGRRRSGPLPGPRTELLPKAALVTPIVRSNMRLVEMLEQAAAASREEAELRGIHISVESDLANDLVSADPVQLLKAVSGLLANFLEIQAEAGHNEETRSEATLVLRAGNDMERGGVKVEAIWIGRTFPRVKIASREEAGAFLDAHHIAMAHGGVLELVPSDSHDILARLRLPVGLTGSTRQTMIR